ncbi:MAG: hypothetical protein K2N35_13380 [Muribaculaceae bacterium]|nr:hypothetical protein [Muribaculaceae bacterium]
MDKKKAAKYSLHTFAQQCILEAAGNKSNPKVENFIDHWSEYSESYSDYNDCHGDYYDAE